MFGAPRAGGYEWQYILIAHFLVLDCKPDYCWWKTDFSDIDL